MIAWRLTDQPGAVRAFWADDAPWRRVEGAEAPAWLAEWAARFNPERPTWVAEGTPAAHPDQPPAMCDIVMERASGSQFDAALAAVREAPERLPDRLICLALTGERFRGQRSRPWSVLPGNLHLTAQYRLRLPAAAAQAGLSMAPAVAAAEAIAALDPRRFRPRIKWVNDILVEDRKVSGVLTGTVGTGGWIERVVFGIGINAAEAPVIRATPFVPAAGCLAEVDPLLRDDLPRLAGLVVDRLDAMVGLLREARTREVVDRYREMAGFLGRDVRIWPEGIEDWEGTHPAHVGRVTAMFPDGSLAVSGSPEPVRSGRLAYEAHCRALGLPAIARATAGGQDASVG